MYKLMMCSNNMHNLPLFFNRPWSMELGSNHIRKLAQLESLYWFFFPRQLIKLIKFWFSDVMSTVSWTISIQISLWLQQFLSHFFFTFPLQHENTWKPRSIKGKFPYKNEKSDLQLFTSSNDKCQQPNAMKLEKTFHQLYFGLWENGFKD